MQRLAFFLVFVTLGCVSSGRFEGGTYRAGDLELRTPEVPSSWRRIVLADAILAFRDDRHAASVLLNGRCGRRDDDTPLGVLTTHLLFGTTEREVLRQELMAFDGREALRTVVRAKLDGVPLQYELLVLKKNNCVYDFVFVASPARFEEGAAVFRQFVGAIRTSRGAL